MGADSKVLKIVEMNLSLVRNIVSSSAVFLVLVFLSQGVRGQSFPILSDFTAEKSGDKIFLNWTINAGNTCNGIFIFRSSDSLHYQKIGEIFGICGSATEPQSYSFFDTDPVKGKRNFYRLELGSVGLSGIVSLFFLIPGTIQLFPNPARERLQVNFENEKKNKVTLQILDRQGRFIQLLGSRDDFIEVSLEQYSPGYYYYNLLNPETGTSFKGSFFKLP
jgi:hypothetical protein